MSHKPLATDSHFTPPAAWHSWKGIVARYQRPSAWRGLWQLANTLIPYAALWWLMYRSLSLSVWLTIPLALLAGGFLVRFLSSSMTAPTPPSSSRAG